MATTKRDDYKINEIKMEWTKREKPVTMAIIKRLYNWADK